MTFDDIICLAIISGTIWLFYTGWKKFSWQKYIYSREHPTMLRMEELRKQYDGVDDLETMVKRVEKNPDVVVYVYITYSELAGGTEKECKIPVTPTSRMWQLLCEEEKKRLYKEIGRAKQIFRLPFHD